MPDSVVEKLIKRLETDSDTQRQTSQEARLNMYLDDYQDKVIATLRTQFHKDNFNRLYPMYATYYNLFKKIVNLKAVLYKREANRKWFKRDLKTLDEKYAEMIKSTNINSIMPTVNKLANVNNNSLCRVMTDFKNKRIQYEAIPSENISVMQDPENPKIITNLLHRVTIKDSNSSITDFSVPGPSRINIRSDKYIQKYFYWDYDNYYVLDANKKVIDNPDNPDNKNPYKDKNGRGIIPYVLFSNMAIVAGNLWNETVNQDLYNGTIQVNVFQTYLNNLIKLAGYRQIYITGLTKEGAAQINEKASDPLQPIAVSDADAKVGSFELAAKIADVQDAIHDIISEIADNHGVEFSSRVSSAQKMSGIALRISHDAIDNLRQEQEPFYRSSENETAEKTVILANKDLKSGIDIEGSFSINFYEDQPELNEADKIKVETFYLKNNLKSIIDLYKEIDPDTSSNEEALKRLNENKKINDALTDLFPFNPIEDSNAE